LNRVANDAGSGLFKKQGFQGALREGGSSAKVSPHLITAVLRSLWLHSVLGALRKIPIIAERLHRDLLVQIVVALCTLGFSQPHVSELPLVWCVGHADFCNIIRCAQHCFVLLEKGPRQRRW
jgi:hypothetical protein